MNHNQWLHDGVDWTPEVDAIAASEPHLVESTCRVCRELGPHRIYVLGCKHERFGQLMVGERCHHRWLLIWHVNECDDLLPPGALSRVSTAGNGKDGNDDNQMERSARHQPTEGHEMHEMNEGGFFWKPNRPGTEL